MRNCPNVIPGAECVDPACAYCKVMRAEEPRPRRVKLVKWPEVVQQGHGQHVYHWCPACERLHVIPDDTGARWTRTGPDEAPTYSPSFLQYDARKLDGGGFGNCHYFIREGQLQFCGDSWHGRTDTVPMPDVPQHVLAKLTEEVFKQ